MNYSVTVKTGSSKAPLVQVCGNHCLTVYLRSQAIEGAANKELIEILAKHFSIPKTSIEIWRGQKSKQKIIRIK